MSCSYDIKTIFFLHFRPDNSAPPDYDEATKNGKLPTKVWRNTKKKLQTNKVTQPFCPPTGEVATTLTLALTVFAIFLSARTVLGPIAGNLNFLTKKIRIE